MEIPSEIEYMKGIATAAIKAGIASVISSKSTFNRLLTIKKPTITSAGAVAKAGIARKIGAKNKLRKNRTAAVTAVRPVRPPTATPALLSTKVVTVEVPSRAPPVVAMESASKAPSIFGSLPSLSSILALEATPIRVPRVSNKSTNMKESMIVIKLKVKIALKSSCMKVGARLGTEIPLAKLGITENIPSFGFGT